MTKLKILKAKVEKASKSVDAAFYAFEDAKKQRKINLDILRRAKQELHDAKSEYKERLNKIVRRIDYDNDFK